MAEWKTYSKTIYGRGGRLFEGVEQGFDPCSEPAGRVQNSVNVEYSAQTLQKRKGYEVAISKNYSSALSISNVDFDDFDGIVVLWGNGDVSIITGV